MSWKKFFKVIDTNGAFGPINGNSSASKYKASQHSAYGNYGSILPEVYVGHPNRIERYNQYENMDADAEVNSALDILAEFCTQTDEHTNLPFQLFHNEKPTETESKILKTQLEAWCNLNEFDKKIFRLFRNVLKYGDQVFIRDPETFKMFWCDIVNVVKVIVNESDGKKPEQYVIKNINPNFETLAATQLPAETLFSTNPNNSGSGSGGGYTAPNTTYSTNGRFAHGLNEWSINSENIVHLSLTEGLDSNWPFGNSILELIFKVYKQKELLEDAIIIYRIQRAPERRVFSIDVGEMPSHLAMAFVDRVKNEMYQRRIPTTAGGNPHFDSTYSPIGMNEDFYFPISSNGRGSKVETLPGGCLEMSTKVPLIDGRTLSLTELTEEFKAGKTNWIYSCDPSTGLVVPGIISWAGVTQESAQVLKITLDNGETIVATPDHKFPILDRDFVDAKDLVVGDRPMPFKEDREIIAIEYLDAPVQVGTLTIDAEEKYHNFHTFALASGIFTKNSNLNEINDLRFFTNKMMRGLRIPASYLPTASADDANAPVAGDGKAGTALIQEFRFNQYCMRLQALIVAVLDVEFKAFLKWSGVNIDTKLFDLKFNVPQNFATYRQAELDQVKIGTFSQLEGYGYFSKRFLMSKYLGMSADDMVENDMMWREENKTPAETSGEANGPDLRNIGITPGGIEGDLENLGPVEGLGEESLEDAEGMPEGPGGAGGGAAGGDTGGAAGGEAGGPSAGGGPGLQP